MTRHARAARALLVLVLLPVGLVPVLPHGASAGAIANAATAATTADPSAGRLSLTRWYVDQQGLSVEWFYRPDDSVELTGFEVVRTFAGGEPEVRRFGPNTSGYVQMPSTGVPDGTAFTWELRALEAGDSGESVGGRGVTGGRYADPITTASTVGAPEEDQVRLSWTPTTAGSDAAYEAEVVLDVLGPDVRQRWTSDEPRLVVAHALGRTTGSFRVRTIDEHGMSEWSQSFPFLYEDQWPAPVSLLAKTRAGGYFLSWRGNPGAGAPDSWLVEVDGAPAEFEATRRRKLTVKGFVTGLAPGTEHTVTVRGVSSYGPGLPLSVTERTADLPGQMPAPTVRTGPDGGARTVTVSWGTPEWGSAAPCCFRVTAVGIGPTGTTTTVRRFVDADLRSVAFAVKSPGPWRFTIEARTGAGFSPVSSASKQVAAA